LDYHRFFSGTVEVGFEKSGLALLVYRLSVDAMRHIGQAVESSFPLLSEEQNASFNQEFHTEEKLAAKFMLLQEWMKDRPFDVLDLGGGNGAFVDRALARFPKNSATIVDVSPLLLSANTPSDRKKLILGSIENLPDIFDGRTFDCITLNWVLHHLVGNSYSACWTNFLNTLEQCKQLLRPNGIVLVAENMFEGYLRSNLPSHLIYAITAIRFPWFVYFARRFFNTAGTGVCFQSQRAWRRVFAQAGFDVIAFQPGLDWCGLTARLEVGQPTYCL
jgi:ubiquinone/menaquinone biosynthesis C-methylase UbiE